MLMKNIYKIKLLLILLLLSYFIFSFELFASAPDVNCKWLPWCGSSNADISKNISISKVSNLIWESIKYVAVIAVMSLMVSWVMYLVSWWDEEKTKKAKTAIIWSLVWVFLSISAWPIINLINKINIS